MPFKTKALRRAQIIPSTTFIQIPLLDSSSDGVFWQKCVGHLDSSKGSTCYEFTYLLTHCQDSFFDFGRAPACFASGVGLFGVPLSLHRPRSPKGSLRSTAALPLQFLTLAKVTHFIFIRYLIIPSPSVLQCKTEYYSVSNRVNYPTAVNSI